MGLGAAAISVGAAALAAWRSGAALHHLRRGRAVRAGAAMAMAVVLAAGAALAAGWALELRSYARLTYERPIAVVEISAGRGNYIARVTRLDGAEASPAQAAREFELRGDEWRMDARVVKWKDWANVLGFDARYRLDRISGRYADVSRARALPPSAHALSGAGGIDLWGIARRHPGWVPWLDTEFGSSVYMPLTDGARYRVSLTQFGLVARPIDG